MQVQGGGISLDVLHFNRSLILDHALQEIKYYQKSTALLIPLRSFSRLVRQVLSELQWGYGDVTRISRPAFGALQSATEHAMITYFEMAFIPFH